MSVLCGSIQGWWYPYEVDSPFCNVRTNITVRQSKSLKDREIGRRFAALWKALSTKSRELFPEGDDTGTSIVLALNVRSQLLSIRDRRNGVGKPVFKFAPFGNGQLFDLTTPDLRVPGFSDDALQQIISQASHLAQDRTANMWWPPFRLLTFSPLGGSRPVFLRFPFLVGYAICALSGSMPDLTRLSASLQGGFSVRLRSPARHLVVPLLYRPVVWARSQSTVTQVQQTNDIDVACYRSLSTKFVTCLQVGPMSFLRPEAPPGGSDQSSLSPSQEDPNDGHLEDALLAPPQLRWRRDALQSPELQRGCLERNTGVHIPEGGLRCVTWNTRGLIGSPFSSQTSR